MELRLATPDDLEDEFRVFELAQHELEDRRGVRPRTRDFADWERVHRHLLRHDGDHCLVAEDHGRLVGYTAAWVRDGVWFLAALFVLPEWQGRGLGKRLLELAWTGEHSRRITITEAIQPVSTATYARRGLIPTTPVVNFEGTPRIAPPDRLEPASLDAGVLSGLDQCAYGFDRSADHLFWSETAASATLWLDRDEPVAYSYVSHTGSIGPIGGRDEAAVASALRAELARRRDERVTVAIPGSSAQVVGVALASGLRMDDPGLLLISPPHDPPRNLALHSYWLL